MENQQSKTHPFQKNIHDTNHAFAHLQEGDMFSEKNELLFIIAIIRKNLVVIYQGTGTDLKPICYPSADDVRKKFAMTAQAGYWVNYIGNDKEFTEKLLNE